MNLGSSSLGEKPRIQLETSSNIYLGRSLPVWSESQLLTWKPIKSSSKVNEEQANSLQNNKCWHWNVCCHSWALWTYNGCFLPSVGRGRGRNWLTVRDVGGAEGLVRETISWIASRSFKRCRGLLIPISLWISVSDKADMMAPLFTLARQAATYQAGIPNQSCWIGK